eukprot:scaffold90757_cov32-Tisochrysis_lutea.AAC.1
MVTIVGYEGVDCFPGVRGWLVTTSAADADFWISDSSSLRLPSSERLSSSVLGPLRDAVAEGGAEPSDDACLDASGETSLEELGMTVSVRVLRRDVELSATTCARPFSSSETGGLGTPLSSYRHAFGSYGPAVTVERRFSREETVFFRRRDGTLIGIAPPRAPAATLFRSPPRTPPHLRPPSALW